VVNLDNAQKLNEFPFPFPYAQLLQQALTIQWFASPIIVAMLCEHAWWAFSLSFATTFFMWSINYVAMEIENPFGDDANDLPLPEMVQSFNEDLVNLLHPLSQDPPRLIDNRNDSYSYVRCPAHLEPWVRDELRVSSLDYLHQMYGNTARQISMQSAYSQEVNDQSIGIRNSNFSDASFLSFPSNNQEYPSQSSNVSRQEDSPSLGSGTAVATGSPTGNRTGSRVGFKKNRYLSRSRARLRLTVADTVQQMGRYPDVKSTFSSQSSNSTMTALQQLSMSSIPNVATEQQHSVNNPNSSSAASVLNSTSTSQGTITLCVDTPTEVGDASNEFII
jgi:hypothetical protein